MPPNPKPPTRFGHPIEPQPTPKPWQIALGIIPDSPWTSSVPAVHNLLRHLARRTKSEDSRRKHLQHLYRFCQNTNKDPDTVVTLNDEEIQSLVDYFIFDLDDRRDYSRNTLNAIIKSIQTFFRANGHTSLKLLTLHIPARYRKKKEYVPTKNEILTMAQKARNLHNLNY